MIFRNDSLSEMCIYSIYSPLCLLLILIYKIVYPMLYISSKTLDPLLTKLFVHTTYWQSHLLSTRVVISSSDFFILPLYSKCEMYGSRSFRWRFWMRIFQICYTGWRPHWWIIFHCQTRCHKIDILVREETANAILSLNRLI